MKYNSPIDYTTEYTHSERVAKTEEVVRTGKDNETLKGDSSDKYKLTTKYSPPIDYTGAYTHSDRMAKNRNKLYIRNKSVSLDSGVYPSLPNLSGSASKITQTEQRRQLWHGLYSTIQPHPPPSSKDKNTEDLEVAVQRKSAARNPLVPPLIISNNKAITQGIFRTSDNKKSTSIVRGGLDSKPYGKITNN